MDLILSILVTIILYMVFILPFVCICVGLAKKAVESLWDA